MRNKVISLAPGSGEDEDGKNQSTESESKTGNKSAEKGNKNVKEISSDFDEDGDESDRAELPPPARVCSATKRDKDVKDILGVTVEEEKMESRVYKNEAAGDGEENEAEVEGDGDSCTEVESSEIGDNPGDGNPEFSEIEDGEKLKQNSASLGEKQRSSNHAHQVLDKMPKTATMTKTKGNFSVSFSDSFLSCSQSSFVNVVDNLAPGKCSVDEINQPSSEVEDMVSDKMPRPILTAEGNSGKPFIPSSSEPFSPCVGFAVNDLNPDRMLGNRRKQVGEKGDFPNPAHKIHGKTELVVSSKCPVPLTWHFCTKTSLLPLLDENGTSINRKLSLNHLQLYSSGIRPEKDEGSRRRFSKNRETNTSYNANASMNGRSLSKNDINTIRRSQVPQVIDILRHLHSRDMLPAIWFIFSRKGCDASVQYLENCKLLDECEISEVELALKRFPIQYPDTVRESFVKGLLRGVAAYNAGCLPLWKSFVEELFQRGLVKVVFATETLAAGINMPARTVVIASLSKRNESGHVQLSSNELFQMAGHAGQRGVDERGHVVLVQTANEGAEECSKLLFSGLEPLVSQFTASYEMVLNLLAGGKITRRSNESDDMKASRAGRTLKEARKLVEQSFGNYVGSNVMLSAKEELSKIQNEIEMLTSEISDEAIDRKTQKLLPDRAYKEIVDLQEELRVEKRVWSELRRRMEIERLSTLRHLLEELEGGDLPFMSLQYNDAEGVQHLVSTVYLGKVVSVDGSKLRNMITFAPALSREFRPYKPDPAPLLHFCSIWEVLPNEVMMIGDSLKDDAISLLSIPIVEYVRGACLEI
ncbi:DExH-box ATP-dependent RNA helicase DExH15 chloroplastic [Sarracenia purpurea var. burkii]